MTPPRPPRKKYRPIRTVESLAEHLQWALAVEYSTIPPYLCALYSIEDKTSSAYGVIRSVALEEMLHMNLVCNLLGSIGHTPQIVANVPSYPGYIPHHAAGGPYIQLMACSKELMTEVFMPIEKPESEPIALPESDYFDTIGQFYKAIQFGFDYLSQEHGEELFAHDTGYQRIDLYIGSGGGRPIRVFDLNTATLAINEIVAQGEGHETPKAPAEGEQPFGAYEHYGVRQDGTYGPILGIPWEMSHYCKFEALATGEVPIPPTYPMQPNPSTDSLDGPVRELSQLFDDCYGLMVRSLELTFSSDRRRSPFFTVGFTLMQNVLPALATSLMQTPIHPQASPDVGPNAGPAFEYRDTALPVILDRVRSLLDSGTDEWKAPLEATRESLEDIRAKTAGLAL